MRGFQSSNANFGSKLVDNSIFGDVRLFPSLTTGSYGSFVGGDPIGSVAGIFGRRYVGYFNDDVTWFSTATLQGDTTQSLQIDNFTNNADSYSWMWLGYFLAATSETYTFFTNSDDASYLWIGSTAQSGYTTANATVNNGGLHGNQERSGTSSLSAGTYYPIRIMFGEQGGGDNITVAFSSPTITKTTNGSGYYFGGRVGLFTEWP